MNYRFAVPEHVIEVSHLPELDRIEVTETAVHVGAAVTHTAVLENSTIRDSLDLLVEAERFVAHEAVRNRGTVCGSLAHADPSAELTGVLALLGGRVKAVSERGEREIPAEAFFEGWLQSSLSEDELIVEAVFPRPTGLTTTAFREVVRRHGDYALCGVAMALDRDGDGPVEGATAAFISVAPVPLVLDLGPVVAGSAPDAIDLRAVYDFVSDSVDPPDNLHASSEYRRHLAGVLAGQALAACL